MAKNAQSILLIAPDKALSDNVMGVLSGLEGVAAEAQDTSVAQLNGSAVKMAAEHDVVIFATDPSNQADLSAIEALTGQRKENSVFLALTDSDMPLSRARALSRAGVDDVLPYPMSDEDLAEQVKDWTDKIRAKAFAEKSAGREGHLILVSQARGGIGSTTVAVNLADQLMAKKGRFKKTSETRVAIVDLDLQFGTVGDFLDTDESEALMQMALDGTMPDDQWVEQSVVETPGGLTVLPAPSKFAPLDALQPAQVEALITALRRTHDYVIVDLPRALVNWIEPVVEAADRMVIVTDTTVPSVRATHKLMEFFKSDNLGLEIEVVINREKKPLMLGNHHKEAAKLLDVKFNHWLPQDPRAAREAIDYGKPLSEVAARSDLNKAIAGLAKATQDALPVRQHASR